MLQGPKDQPRVAAALFGGHCVLPLAASGVYPKTRVWGSKPENVHCSGATAPLKIELRWGCKECSEKTAVGSGVAFKYDGLGRRVQKAFTQGSTTTTTNYLYDGNNAVADVDPNGNVLARYTATQNIDEPLAELRSSTTSYYSQDGLSSVTSLTTSAGALGNTYRYDSFGKLTASSGSIANRFQYTSREFDTETGVYSYRARYYDPNAGRFLTEDPIRFKGGANFYTYASNNPVALTDPSGLFPNGSIGGIGSGGCSYYDKHCKSSCPPDSYACRAATCCRSFGDSPKANCTRECLIDWDLANCSMKPGSDRAHCRVLAHIICYSKCQFFPNLGNLDISCLTIADGY